MKKHNPMFNPESRAKLSKSKTGKKLGAVHSEKFKEERRNRWLGSGNPNYGGISIERRQNLSKTKKRLYASGQIKPSPQKKGKDNPRYGIPRSNETKEKIRKRLTGKVRIESTKQKIRQARAKQKNFGQAGSFSEKCLHTILDELGGIEYDIHVGHLPGSPDILINTFPITAITRHFVKNFYKIIGLFGQFRIRYKAPEMSSTNNAD